MRGARKSRQKNQRLRKNISAVGAGGSGEQKKRDAESRSHLPPKGPSGDAGSDAGVSDCGQLESKEGDRERCEMSGNSHWRPPSTRNCGKQRFQWQKQELWLFKNTKAKSYLGQYRKKNPRAVACLGVLSSSSHLAVL